MNLSWWCLSHDSLTNLYVVLCLLSGTRLVIRLNLSIKLSIARTSGASESRHIDVPKVSSPEKPCGCWHSCLTWLGTTWDQKGVRLSLKLGLKVEQAAVRTRLALDRLVIKSVGEMCEVGIRTFPYKEGEPLLEKKRLHLYVD